MLYTETVTPQCLAYLKRLMEISDLNHFYLVGGTALSLRYGHRLSEDIDLFSDKDFDNNELEKLIRFYFSDIESTNFHHTAFGIYCHLDDVKVDFMKWNEEWIDKYETEEAIRIASDKDIFAMKLQAAMTRGAKKDFFDLALLIENYSLNKGIEWYRKKYPYNDAMIPLKSLTDFEMAEDQTSPVLLKSKPWHECKKIIIDAVKRMVEEV
jgi:predicted nucleotidyltransferase component of viral defense system